MYGLFHSFPPLIFPCGVHSATFRAKTLFRYIYSHVQLTDVGRIIELDSPPLPHSFSSFLDPRSRSSSLAPVGNQTKPSGPEVILPGLSRHLANVLTLMPLGDRTWTETGSMKLAQEFYARDDV